MQQKGELQNLAVPVPVPVRERAAGLTTASASASSSTSSSSASSSTDVANVAGVKRGHADLANVAGVERHEMHESAPALKQAKLASTKNTHVSLAAQLQQLSVPQQIRFKKGKGRALCICAVGRGDARAIRAAHPLYEPFTLVYNNHAVAKSTSASASASASASDSDSDSVEAGYKYTN